MFTIFFSFNNTSFGTVCVILTMALLFLNFNASYLSDISPFVISCFAVLIILFMSGQFSERGFNAPVNHALKFVNLMFTASMSASMKNLPESNRRSIFKWTMISILISAVISLYHVIAVDKYAIRYSVQRGFNVVVSFDQFYGICIFLCTLAFALFTWHKKYKTGKYLILCFILLFCVALSLFVTGMLICMFGIALGIAVKKYDKSKRNAILWAMAIAVLLIIIFTFGEQVSDLIYQITEPLNFVLRDRVRNVADTIFGTDHNLSYSYDRRNELAWYSITTFLRNPIFGIGYKGYGYGVIGCHQEWQDMLGVFGLFGTFLFVILMIIFSKQVIKNISNKKDLHSFYIALILFIILGFLNPCLSQPVLCAVFIIAPNISLLFPLCKETNQELLSEEH